MYLGDYRDLFSCCSWRNMGTADNTWALSLITPPNMPPNQSYDGERNSLDGSSLSVSSQDSNANPKEPRKSSLVKAAEEGSREWSRLSVRLHASLCSWLSVLKRLLSPCWRARRGRTVNYFSFPCAVTALEKAGSGLVFLRLLLFLQLSDLNSGISREVHSKFSVSKLFLWLDQDGISRWNII